MTVSGRIILALSAALCVAGLSPSPALAQNAGDFYKGKTVKVFIGYDPGGTYDLTGRVVAKHIAKHIPANPTVVPQNMPGAGSLVLANYLYNIAPKDGTEFGIFARTIPIEPLVGTQETKFDAKKFTWLGSTANEVSTCVSWNSSPVKTADDLLTKELVVGAAGAAAPSAVFPNVFNAVLKTKFKVINGYTSSAAALLAMEKGETEGYCVWGWTSMQATQPGWVKDKKFNVLFQIGVRKAADHPDVPLVLDMAKNAEDRQVLDLIVGVQGFARPFAAPPGLPADRAAILKKAFEDTVRDPDFLAEADKLKLEPELVTGADVEAILARLYATPPAIIARAKAAQETK
jgi:tripartite-type tricarboxylate transporter receptor subunit TctC